MQSKDNVADNLASRYAELADDPPQPYPSAKRNLALIASWLVPGGGHLVLGKYGRGLLFLFTIAGAFLIGLSLHARLFYPIPTASTEVSSSPDYIGILWFFAQIGSGLCYLLSYAVGAGTVPQPGAATFEYGNAFTFLAGLLNYLVMHDAFDIGAGRKK